MATVEKWRPRRGSNKPRWRTRWRSPDGRSQSKVFDRRVDAERHLTAMEHQKLTGSYVDPAAGKVTFREYAEDWRSRQVHRQSTQDRVEIMFRRHAYPALGERELSSIRPSHLQALVRDRLEVLAPSTVVNLYHVVAEVFSDAVNDEVIGRTPCRGVRLPRLERVEVIPPTVEQVMAIGEAIVPRYRVAVALAAGAGLRLGEVLGLQFDNVDLLRRSVAVEQQLTTPNAGTPRLGPLKTPASRRRVPLADAVIAEVARHIESFPPVDGFVVTTSRNAPVRRTTFQAAWARACRKAGEDQVRFHDLRHHYASALIAAGCSVKAVQASLGHASASETLDTYSHLWPSDEDSTRLAIDALWGSRRVTDVSPAVDVGSAEG